MWIYCLERVSLWIAKDTFAIVDYTCKFLLDCMTIGNRLCLLGPDIDLITQWFVTEVTESVLMYDKDVIQI